jgi:hypothetical protein
MAKNEMAGKSGESRLQQLCVIIHDSEDAKAEFTHIYKECQIPLWIREALSTFIEEREW